MLLLLRAGEMTRSLAPTLTTAIINPRIKTTIPRSWDSELRETKAFRQDPEYRAQTRLDLISKY